MNKGRALQVAAMLISIGVISGTVMTLARKYGGTIPGMIARILKWFARWVTNAAIQYDVFLCNWREYVDAHPIVMKCEKRNKTAVTSNLRQLKKAQ